MPPFQAMQNIGYFPDELARHRAIDKLIDERKVRPDEREYYDHICRRVLAPSEVLMLNRNFGSNLKTARNAVIIMLMICTRVKLPALPGKRSSSSFPVQ